ncbi:MAG: internal scaffolding protein [Microviridae sp.]|nr:MAG: internal scaffolding protein [Microviridae sp.]
MSYNPQNLKPITTNENLIQSNYSLKIKPKIDFTNEVSLTKQEFKEECDINVLMSKYMTTGELPFINERMPMYEDVTGYDFQEAMQFVASAQSLFQEMPSELRSRFHNDPAEFLDFTSNENNRAEMASLGLLKPEREWVEPPTYEPPTKPDLRVKTEPPSPPPSSPPSGSEKVNP